MYTLKHLELLMDLNVAAKKIHLLSATKQKLSYDLYKARLVEQLEDDTIVVRERGKYILNLIEVEFQTYIDKNWRMK